MTTEELEAANAAIVAELELNKAANASLSEHLLKLQAELDQAKADNLALAHARDTFKAGFEEQSRAHGEAQKIIERLRAEASPKTDA